MPNNDGTGPNGEGTRTGRGAGNCSDTGAVKRPMSSGRGRRGGGQGRGLNRNQGNSWLQNQIDELKASIQKLTDRKDGTDK